MNIQIIDTGYFYADGGAMFGAIPKTAWSRRYPSNDTNGCVLAMRSLLISNIPEKVILVDNGAGTKHLKQLSYYNFFDLVDLGEELQKRGITAGQVTDVVLTHLHFDHCGYSTLKNEETGEILSGYEMRKFDDDIEEPENIDDITDSDIPDEQTDNTLAEEKAFAKAFDSEVVCRLSELLGDCFILA